MDISYQTHMTYLVAHNIPKQHDVAGVNAHAVALHRVVNLVDDRLPSRLDSEHLRHLDDVVGCRLLPDDALRGHDFLQAIALNEEFLVALLAAVVIPVLDVDDRTADRRDALDHHVGQRTLEFAEAVVFVGAVDVDAQAVLSWDDGDRFLLDFELPRADDGPLDVV